MRSARCTRFVPAIAVLCSLGACAGQLESGGSEAPMDSLVTAEWLAGEIGDPDLVILDCTVLIEQAEDGRLRSVNGRANYEAGHIPTAGFADLMGELSDTDSPYQFAVPSPEAFAAAMGELGVGDDSRVVLYDDNGSFWSARVWWMLRWIGFDRAAILDGGLAAWEAAGHPLSTDTVTREARELATNVRPGLIADRDEVRASLGEQDVKLIDALSPEHYSGEMSMYGRPGHIPGAANVPVLSLIDESGRYRPADELRSLFDTGRDERTITYCGGGIAASGVAFALTRLGYEDVAVYTNSLQEWAADPDNPLETTE